MKEKIEIKLSEWAKENNLKYKEAWNLYDKGALPAETKITKSGRVMVLQESKASMNPKNVTLGIPQMTNSEDTQTSYASTSTRRNKVATSTITDKFFHIASGISPNSIKETSEAIRLVQLGYHNFSVLKNICNLMSEFSSSKIYWRGGTAKSRRFHENLWNYLNILDFQDKFFLEYYRSNNVFIYRFDVKVKDNALKEFTTAFEIQAKKDTKLPSKYIILNPVDIACKGNIEFTNATYYKKLNGYELSRLKLPADKQTEQDKNFLNSLPEDIQKQIKQGTNIEIPLKPENTFAIFYKKQDYENMAVPMFYCVLGDINAKAEQKNLDLSASRCMTQVILLVKMGYESKNGEYMFDQTAATAMRELFTSESIGKVLCADFTTDAKWVVPELSNFLDPKKYQILNEDIKRGLNDVLTGGDSKFANQFIQTQIFVQRLQQAREAFLTNFLIPETKRIHDSLGLKGSYPKPVFQDFNLNNKEELNRIIVRLTEVGVLTAPEALNAIETSRIPTEEESLESQEKFVAYKKKGYYEPLTGGPSSQLNLQKETFKNQEKMLDKTQEHDDKQKTKDRKHAAENPEPVAPQIHINAPGIKKPSGKPTGKTGKQSTTRKTSPMKASLEEDQDNDNIYEEKYSLSKFKDNMILIGELNGNIKTELLKKYKLKELNKSQNEILQGISEVIISDQNPENWNNKDIIAKYIENPIASDESRLNKINEIAANHSISLYLASILLNSEKIN